MVAHHTHRVHSLIWRLSDPRRRPSLLRSGRSADVRSRYTGFLTDYDLKEEYRQLAITGLGFQDVLAMLTTNPAQRFGAERREGRVAVGMEGNLTIPAKDPAVDGPVSMTEVKYTIRQGRAIFDAARLPVIGTSTSSH
jgi:hypothetical protein